MATIQSATIQGVTAVPVKVTVTAVAGLPTFKCIGLAESMVRETRLRVTSALKTSGFDVSLPRHVTAALYPADLRKESAALDLPIALAWLAELGEVPATMFEGVAAVGELGLDGTVRKVRGALAHAEAARKNGATVLIVPAGCEELACLAADFRPSRAFRVYAVRTLRDAADMIREQFERSIPTWPLAREVDPPVDLADFADVHGQDNAIRQVAACVAAGAGVLLVGPPGAGKSMLARRVPSILPPLTREEALEVTRIYSAAGIAPDHMVQHRPFRAPHHTISDAGLLGGGSVVRPGEVTLAHHGVLFLDELFEFRRSVIEGLRGALRDGEMRVWRSDGDVHLPTRCVVVAAANPCPCSGLFECRCAGPVFAAYSELLASYAKMLNLATVRVDPVPRGWHGPNRWTSAELREHVARAQRYRTMDPSTPVLEWTLAELDGQLTGPAYRDEAAALRASR